MKPKKVKKQRPNVHSDFRMPPQACEALSDALIFLLNLKDYSFEHDKISEESAGHAEDKLSNHETVLTRGEVRATAKAIEVVLQRLPGNLAEYSYMDKLDPDFLSDLESELEILQELLPIFQQAVMDLKKMK